MQPEPKRQPFRYKGVPLSRGRGRTEAMDDGLLRGRESLGGGLGSPHRICLFSYHGSVNCGALGLLACSFFGPPTLVDMVRHRERCQPNDTAFVYLVDGEHEQMRFTNAELDRQARAIGAWLESLNLVGERALLLYPPGVEFVAAFLGCLYAGVIAVPVYPPRRNRSMARIQAIADDAEAKVALTTDLVARRVESLIDTTPHLKALAWLPTDHVPAGMDQRWERPDIHGDTIAFLQFTLGFTGTPKGVVLNHANLIHNSALIAYAFEHTRTSLGVFWLPSYHDMGLIGGILQPLHVGRPNILMSPMAFLQKPFRWLSAISRFGTPRAGGQISPMICAFARSLRSGATLDLSTWEVAFNGAEPVREDTIEQFCETFSRRAGSGERHFTPVSAWPRPRSSSPAATSRNHR